MKAKIIKIIAVICYYSGLVKLFYRLNRHSKRIVTFHNVIPANLLPKGKKIGLVDTEDEFENKIIELSRYFSFSNDLRDAKSITITFDDGYKNQFEIAGRILEHLGNINATVFVSGAVLNCNSENALTVDLLMHWIELAPEGEYYILDFLKADPLLKSDGYNHTSQLRPQYSWPASQPSLAIPPPLNINEL